MPGEEYIKKLLSPCVRETSNEVAERVSLHGYTIIVTHLLMFNVEQHFRYSAQHTS